MRYLHTRNPAVIAMLTVLLCAVSLAVADPTDDAQQEAEDREVFASADANGDGKITQEEALAIDPNQRDFFTRLFAAVDTDKDGSVVFDELRAFLKKVRQAVQEAEQEFNARDLNTDGKLTLAEATAHKTGEELSKAESDFKKADENSDGFMDKDELNRSVVIRLIEP